MNKRKLKDLKKNFKLKIIALKFFQSTKSPHFPLRGKIERSNLEDERECFIIIILLYSLWPTQIEKYSTKIVPKRVIGLFSYDLH